MATYLSESDMHFCAFGTYPSCGICDLCRLHDDAVRWYCSPFHSDAWRNGVFFFCFCFLFFSVSPQSIFNATANSEQLVMPSTHQIYNQQPIFVGLPMPRMYGFLNHERTASWDVFGMAEQPMAQRGHFVYQES